MSSRYDIGPEHLIGPADFFTPSLILSSFVVFLLTMQHHHYRWLHGANGLLAHVTAAAVATGARVDGQLHASITPRMYTSQGCCWHRLQLLFCQLLGCAVQLYVVAGKRVCCSCGCSAAASESRVDAHVHVIERDGLTIHFFLLLSCLQCNALCKVSVGMHVGFI